MSLKVLFFFPHNPYPPKSGAHKRCLEMLAALRELGCQVTLMSSTLCSETKWDISSIQSLKANWVTDVSIYKPTRLDYKLISLLRSYYRFTKQKPPVSSVINTPPGMRSWFKKHFHITKPEIIFMNYAYWDCLCRGKKFLSSRKIIDMHDLITLNTAMQEAIKKYLVTPLSHDSKIDALVLQEDFFELLSLEASSEEFSIYNKYDYTIVISSKEIELVKSKTSNTKIAYIPVQQTPYNLNNQYDGRAIFVTGPNLFNIQGYLYFTERILPLVLQKDSTFLLQITGASCKDLYPTDGVLLSGFVPSLTETYQMAKFAICPVFGGTGQQIKIVEAMAHGIPVVATYFAGERSPIIHNENGFIAKNHTEFAEYVLQLWQDRNLCQRLGENARETIATSFSRDSLIKDLSIIIN